MKHTRKKSKNHNVAQDNSKIRPKKSLGQNFLKDETVLQKIINAGELKPEDHVVEVGPGHGVLTEKLAEKVKKVTAIELDDRFIVELKLKFLLSQKIKNQTLETKGAKRPSPAYGARGGGSISPQSGEMEGATLAPILEIIHGDALKINPPKENYKVVANIPYYITSPLIHHFLMPPDPQSKRPELMVLLTQKEVAEKITDPKKESVISLFIKLFGKASIVDLVKAEAFEPKPKVDSAILKIEGIGSPKIKDIQGFLKFIKIGFHSPRKKIHNNLSRGLSLTSEQVKKLLKKADIDSNVRPENIKLEEWIRLFKKHHSNPPSSPPPPIAPPADNPNPDVFDARK